MAGNDNNQQILEKIDNNQPDSVFEQEQSRKAYEVIAILSKSKEIWNIYSTKQDILQGLYVEQMSTSQIFVAINEMKRDYGWFFDGNTAFLEIDEEVTVNLTLLEEFEEKLDGSSKIVKDFIRDMKVHLAKLTKELNTVETAETVDDMAEMDVPNLDWVESTPDHEIDQLADNWDKMQLKARTNKLLIKLRSLI